jgi:hypothetical protein
MKQQKQTMYWAKCVGPSATIVRNCNPFQSKRVTKVTAISSARLPCGPCGLKTFTDAATNGLLHAGGGVRFADLDRIRSATWNGSTRHTNTLPTPNPHQPILLRNSCLLDPFVREWRVSTHENVALLSGRNRRFRGAYYLHRLVMKTVAPLKRRSNSYQIRRRRKSHSYWPQWQPEISSLHISNHTDPGQVSQVDCELGDRICTLSGPAPRHMHHHFTSNGYWW